MKMADSRGVPLERVPAAERVYEREAVLGRDATSVFPTETQPAQGEAGGANAFESMGAVKFVTETELADIKAKRGERVEDGTFACDKSLAEVLAENKAKKEEEFQAVWHSMKVGKNRPLDEDEAGFYEDLQKNTWFMEKANKEAEEDELTAFKLARAERMMAEAAEPTSLLDPALLAPQAPAPVKRRAPNLLVKPVAKFKVVPKKGSNAGSSKSSAPEPRKADDSDEDVGGGLLGIAAYGSDSD